MTEVNLVKRFCIFALSVFLLGGVIACTRDKPAEPTPTLPPRTVVAASSSASVASSSSAATTVVAPASPVVTTTVEITTTPVIVVPPTSTPPPTPTQAPLPSTSTTPGKYTVKWGDWLNKIASENGVTVQAILAANPGLNPNLIYPGQVINLPTPGGSTSSASSSTSSTPTGNPSTYTVRRGEWIYAIARRFGVSVAALLAANPGINPNFLYPGQVLNIPGGSSSSSASSSTGSGGTYTVRPGDTLFSIAVKFRTTTYALQIKNNLANPHFIYPGQVLQIP
jgi:LysM repeat protein